MISLVETMLIGQVEVKEEEITVNLLTIYDKSDTDKELKDLIKALHEAE